jgi:hypothetical protein
MPTRAIRAIFYTRFHHERGTRARTLDPITADQPQARACCTKCPQAP